MVSGRKKGIELVKGGMKNIKGEFYESEVFENLPKEEVEETKNFRNYGS